MKTAEIKNTLLTSTTKREEKNNIDSDFFYFLSEEDPLLTLEQTEESSLEEDDEIDGVIVAAPYFTPQEQALEVGIGQEKTEVLSKNDEAVLATIRAELNQANKTNDIQASETNQEINQAANQPADQFFSSQFLYMNDAKAEDTTSENAIYKNLNGKSSVLIEELAQQDNQSNYEEYQDAIKSSNTPGKNATTNSDNVHNLEVDSNSTASNIEKLERTINENNDFEANKSKQSSESQEASESNKQSQNSKNNISIGNEMGQSQQQESDKNANASANSNAIRAENEHRNQLLDRHIISAQGDSKTVVHTTNAESNTKITIEKKEINLQITRNDGLTINTKPLEASLREQGYQMHSEQKNRNGQNGQNGQKDTQENSEQKRQNRQQETIYKFEEIKE
jgi:hypothetical protein